MLNISEKKEIISQFISPFVEMAESDLEQLSTIADIRSFSRGDTLLAEGQIARYISIVTRGMFRNHCKVAGKDCTESFVKLGDVIMPAESLFSQDPSLRLVTSLMESTCICFSYEGILELSRRNMKVHDLLIALFKAALLLERSRMDDALISSTKARYINFCNKYPEASVNANVAHIASYLHMAPETLSRLRSSVLV